MDTNPEMEVTSDADVEDRLAAQFEKAAQQRSEPEAEEPEEESDEEVSDDETSNEAESEPEEEEEELELDGGKKYKVPKELKAGYLRQKDYTQKTQEVAEQRRQVEEGRKFLQFQATIQQAQYEKAVELKQLQATAQQYEAAMEQALAQQDAGSAMNYQLHLQKLQRDIQGKTQELNSFGQQVKQATEQHRQTLAAEGFKAIKSKFPQWGPELQSAIADNTKGYGFTEGEISEIFDPRLVEVLHDAMQWKKLQASKPAATKKANAAKPLVKTTGRGYEKSQETSKVADLKARLKKTGRAEDAENLLAARFAQSFRRK